MIISNHRRRTILLTRN